MSKKLTRREFIKGTAAGALGVAALGLTGIPAARSYHKHNRKHQYR